MLLRTQIRTMCFRFQINFHSFIQMKISSNFILKFTSTFDKSILQLEDQIFL